MAVDAAEEAAGVAAAVETGTSRSSVAYRESLSEQAWDHATVGQDEVRAILGI